jgi:putative oxidoreductase
MRRAGGSSATQAWGTTLIRLIVGVVLAMHGYLALVILGPQTVAGYVSRMGYPASLATILAWYLVAAHLAGGILIIIGLWTRWAALANIPPVASAVLLLHANQGFFMKVVEGPAGRSVVGGYEFSLTVLVATIALVLLGSGAASVDGARR